MTFLITSLFFPLFFLFGSIVLTTCSSAFLKLGKFKSKEFLKAKNRPLFFFFPILKKFFPKHEWENLYFFISISKHIFHLAYAISAFFYLAANIPNLHALLRSPSPEDIPYLLLIAGLIVTISLSFDYMSRLAANLWTRTALRLAAPFASLALLALFPIVGTLLHLTRGILRKLRVEEETAEQLTDKSKLRDLINESELQPLLDPSDQKLIYSYVNLKKRVAKEIMVPRGRISALPESTSIKQAATHFANEGYSRIPIYEDSLDEIKGLVLYKDLLRCFTTPAFDLNAPMSSIAKKVLFFHENNKVAQLLQEFRKQQVHMAIIVDEYGGTEGLVTFEDILEELIGEIEDESDVEDERLYRKIPGGWIVDAKMTLIDIEEQLGIKIPANPEDDYETIGGYVIHCKGKIPNTGWRHFHDDFELQVLSSTPRAVNKIKIIPRTQ